MATTNEKDRSTVALETANLEGGERGFAARGPISAVDGSTRQFGMDGQLRLIPFPTGDPNDPLNFSKTTKGLAIASVCLFGAIALSVQQIFASLLPVFMLVYAGLDPKVLNSGGGFGSAVGGGPPGAGGPPHAGNSTGGPPPGIAARGAGGNPLEALGHIPGAEPLSRVNLLTSLPMLVIGISSYILVPASVTFGRRPVLLFCSLLCTLTTMWAGLSHGLKSHLAARCINAVGAGAIESLIPLVLQDMTYIHQRSRAISVTWASLGVVTISLGMGSSYIVARMSWRWLYFIISIITGISFVMMALFLPETRWHRSSEELRGEKPTTDAETDSSKKSANSASSYTGGTYSRWGLFANGGVRPKNGWTCFIEIVRSLAFPIVIYMIIINSIFLGIGIGCNVVNSTVLLAPPYNWPIDKIGNLVVTGFVASVLVMLVGWIADRVVSWIAKRRGGRREAEYNLWNLVFPLVAGVLGCILFGIGGQYVHKVHWMAIVAGTTMITFAMLMVNVLASVVALESYPKLAGAVLVNVASFRNIVGFGFTYGIPDWVASRGYMGTFGIMAGVMAFVALFLPVFFIYGKKLRMMTQKIVDSKTAETSL